MNQDEENSIINLKKYIKEDNFYNGKLKIESDFDEFCYEHCKDIHNVLLLVQKQKNEIQKMTAQKIFIMGLRYGKNLIQKNIERAEEFEKLKKENEKLKEYIRIAPNLDEMTAIKYINIQRDSYVQGRAEEQQKTEQIIYENYISKQKKKEKIEEYQNMLKNLNKRADADRIKAINEKILSYKELLESE